MTRTAARTVPAIVALLAISVTGCGGGKPPPAERMPIPTQSLNDTPMPPPQPFPPPGKVFLGVNTNAGAYDFAAVDDFTKATGYRPAAMQFTQGWESNEFDRGLFDRITERKMLPILSWEPWDYELRGGARDNGEQPRYRLANIIKGDYDNYIRSWATGIAALPYPVVMRFAHEMNGFWYPWCEESNQNKPGEYVQAWKHVHRIFAEAKARNVTWMWSPNVTYNGATPLAGLYPGDEFVDWIGLSGYYGTAGAGSYRSFSRIFEVTFKELATITQRPIVITETGATNAKGEREKWVREMFAQLPQHPQVIGVIWFEAVKEIDWRLAASPAAAKAFGENAESDRYQTPWTTRSLPTIR